MKNDTELILAELRRIRAVLLEGLAEPIRKERTRKDRLAVEIAVRCWDTLKVRERRHGPMPDSLRRYFEINIPVAARQHVAQWTTNILPRGHKYIVNDLSRWQESGDIDIPWLLPGKRSKTRQTYDRWMRLRAPKSEATR